MAPTPLVVTGRRLRPQRTRPARATAGLVAAMAVALAVGATSAFSPAIAAGVVIGSAILVATVVRPAVGGLFLVTVVPATSGLAAGVPVPGLRPSEAAILAIGVLLALVPLRRAQAWDGLDWAVASYCLGSAAVAMFHQLRTGAGIGTGFEAVAPVQFLLLYRIVATTLGAARERSLALRLLLATSIPISLIGVLQQLDVGSTREVVGSLTRGGVFQTWVYAHHPRATSIFPNWHTFGGYLVVIALVGLAWLAVGSSSTPRGLVLVSLAGAAAGLALSQTITAILAVAFGALVILNRARAWELARWLLLLGGAAVALFGSFLTDRIDQQWGATHDGLLPQTIDYRIDVWTDQYLPLLGRYFPIGYGVGVPPGVVWEHTESGYITLLLRGGLPLLVLAGVLLLRAYASGHRLETSVLGDDRAIALGALTLAVALVPMNLVWPYLTNSGLSQAFFVLLGLLRAAKGGSRVGPPE